MELQSLLLLQIPLTIIKPGEKSEVPIGVVIGSALAGLLLLAALVAALWKVFYVTHCLPSYQALSLIQLTPSHHPLTL